jgi:hypothetical protein
MFTVACTSDKIWNLNELLDYLIANQHKDIKLKIEPEAICLTNLGLYTLLDKFTFSNVTIFTQNLLEKHNRYIINSSGAHNFWFDKIETIDSDLLSWNKNKIFYCLYGRPTASRLGLCAYLDSHYPTVSHLHFSTPVTDDTLPQFEFDKLLTYRKQSIAEAGNLINKMPLLLADNKSYTYNSGYVYTDPLTTFYQDIFVDLLSESHVLGNTFYPTEKTLRPMWLKKPFIIFASRDYLCNLRKMGFQTFNNYWSEDYDGYEGKDRFLKILDVIDYLAKKSILELETMYKDMSNVLFNNHKLLAQQTYTKFYE